MAKTQYFPQASELTLSTSAGTLKVETIGTVLSHIRVLVMNTTHSWLQRLIYETLYSIVFMNAIFIS
jgi:hypothetical protein